MALLAMVVASPLAANPIRFLAFGDSITWGHGDAGAVCFRSQPATPAGYPPRLERRLAEDGLDARVENHGVCGETTAEGLSRVDTVLADGGDVLLLMEGTNDLSGWVSLESIRFNLREMARKARQAGVEPVYASVIPRGSECGNNARTANLGGWLAFDAEQAGHPFADPYTLLASQPHYYERYYYDPWHTNGRGYDLVAEVFVEPAKEAVPCRREPEPCIADAHTLCLQEGRFAVQVEWTDEEAEPTLAQARSQSADTGFFWFFDADNIELAVKVLDGRQLNDHFWVFFGSLTDVAYTLTVSDSLTGSCRRYVNAPGRLASLGDTVAFYEASTEEGGGAAAQMRGVPLPFTDIVTTGASEAASATAAAKALASGLCAANSDHLCLQGERFEVGVSWRDFTGEMGTARAVPLTDESGYFWFFAESNIELVVKVLDGRAINGQFWVFYGALSNLEYTLTVTDRETGQEAVYVNELGSFASAADTEAFPNQP